MKKSLLLFCLILLVSIIIFVSNQPRENGSADLLEAYQIANAEAMKWNASAKPYFISSVDDPIESKYVKGENGKRNYWNFDFVVENTNHHFIITLHNKTIVHKTEAESSTNNDYIINIQDVCITTEEAVTIAKEHYGLLPGTDWAIGYHFVLENEGSVLVLSVVGINEDGIMSRVFFNAKTGEVIR